MVVLNSEFFIVEVAYGGGAGNTEKYKKLIAKDYQREFPQYCHRGTRDLHKWLDKPII